MIRTVFKGFFGVLIALMTAVAVSAHAQNGQLGEKKPPIERRIEGFQQAKAPAAVDPAIVANKECAYVGLRGKVACEQVDFFQVQSIYFACHWSRGSNRKGSCTASHLSADEVKAHPAH